MKRALVSLLILLSLAFPAAAQQRLVPESREQITLSFAPLVRRAAPAVVNIYTQRVVRERAPPLLGDPLFQQFFGQMLPFGMPRQRVENSLGSGVLVSPDGLIVTNHHVIEGSDGIRVVLADRREFNATLVSSDEHTDLAVLRIEPPRGENLPFLELRDSDELEVGDLVLAIGNPFGVGQTVTSGIVSAVARTGVGISDYNFFIQTDAAINPGNSGGALISMDGRLAGINTAIFSRSGGSMGIGFAIPSNMVRTVIDAVRNGGRLIRPWLGISAQAITSDLAPALGLSRPVGVLVSEIDPRSPAAKAGLRAGDVVVSINDRPVNDPESLRYRVATLPLGSRVTLALMRKGKPGQVAFTVQAPPEDPPRDITALSGTNPLAGATVANLSPALVEEIGLAGATQGVVVLEVPAGSPAGQIGLRPGDILVSINDQNIPSVASLVRLLRRGGHNWSITVQRGDRLFTIQVAV